jgi:hypothetical protein
LLTLLNSGALTSLNGKAEVFFCETDRWRVLRRAGEAWGVCPGTPGKSDNHYRKRHGQTELIAAANMLIYNFIVQST